MNGKLFQKDHIRLVVGLFFIGILLIVMTERSTKKHFLSKWIIYANNSSDTPYSNASRYDYYVCTQVWNETDEHMIEWIEHQIFRLGFRNICMISVEVPLNSTLVTQYHLATITKTSHAQEWKYCLECFTDPPMRPQDMLMIQVSRKRCRVPDIDLKLGAQCRVCIQAIVRAL